ncbi:Hemolysin C [compost metagenome]
MSTDLPIEVNKQIALEQLMTRYPVCESDKDNIIGFIHIKDLLKDTQQQLYDIREIMRPIMTVPESMQISTLLKLMQMRKTQIAILIDEYGGTSGLVTLEDIMEEIVGEIQDEFDEEREAIEKRDEHTYSISGMMLVEEVNSFFGLDMNTDDYDTIGGWLYSRIDLPPACDQRIEYSRDVSFVIEETDHLRITRITVYKCSAAMEALEKRQHGS